MLEGHDRRERRHVRRRSQDFGAVDRVALHDGELFGRERSGLLRISSGRPDLPDVVQQRREAEFTQQRTVDAQRPGLRHRQDRHVHHVRERVVVVFAQRRQREQRRAVLGDRLREAVDHRARDRRVGLPSDSALSQTASAAWHGVGVHPAEGRHVAVANLDPLDRRVTRPTRICGSDGNVSPLFSVVARSRHEVRERGDLARVHPTIDRDPLDADLPQPADERPHGAPCAGRARRRRRSPSSDDADDERRARAGGARRSRAPGRRGCGR